jgi:hypothetical protein
MVSVSASSWSHPSVRRAISALSVLMLTLLASRTVRAEDVSARVPRSSEGGSGDGVYGRFDGDLDLGLALGAELGSAGNAAPSLRATAHYFSVAGVYVNGRIKAGDESAPSLFGLGVDLRPLFLPRWVKGLQTGTAFFDLTLDSLSLSLGAFWAKPGAHEIEAHRGFDAQLGLGFPLLATAAGPWLEARGALRYPDGARREEAVLLLLSWHGFVTTPFSRGSGL